VYNKSLHYDSRHTYISSTRVRSRCEYRAWGCLEKC